MSSYSWWSGLFALGCLTRLAASILQRRLRPSWRITALGWIGVGAMLAGVIARLR